MTERSLLDVLREPLNLKEMAASMDTHEQDVHQESAYKLARAAGIAVAEAIALFVEDQMQWFTEGCDESWHALNEILIAIAAAKESTE